jgi:triphosphoribosyl-dephospho-CoA synthase
LANPGGLGKVKDHDIGEKDVNIKLLEAMNHARERDNIAKEYVTDYEITFSIGLPELLSCLKQGVSLSNAIIHTHLTILSKIPDTLISRKNGIDKAREVSDLASDVLKNGGIFSEKGKEEIKRLDNHLRNKANSLNPGTTADIVTAVLFVYLMDSGFNSSGFKGF